MPDLAIVLTTIKDLVTTAAAVIGVCIAAYGLKTWRRQIRGQSEHAVARAVLRDVYKWRDAIEVVRHPWMSAGEMALGDEDQREGLGLEKLRFLGYLKAYDKRWAVVTEARRELRVNMFDARALWGADLSKPVEQLDRLAHELNNAVHRNIRMQDPSQADDAIKATRKVHDERRDVLYLPMGEDEPDPYGSEFNSAIAEIEKYLRPKI